MTDTNHIIPAANDDQVPLAQVILSIQNDLVRQWEKWLEEQVSLQQLSDLTRYNYRNNISYWLVYLEKLARTDRPTPATVQAYVQNLIISNLEPATVNAYLNAVKSFYRWCETRDLFPAIARSLKSIRNFRDGPLPALTHDQVSGLIADIPEETLGDLRDRALIAFMYTTALRTISVERANIIDVDFDACAVRHQPKGHRAKGARSILPRPVVELLARYLERRKKEIGIPIDSDERPLFIALDRRCAGERMTTRSIRRQVLHYMELSGHAIRRGGKLVNPGVFSAHSIRRSAAVTTADAAGIEVAQGLLGHASLETTKKAYARIVLERKLRDNANRLDPL